MALNLPIIINAEAPKESVEINDFVKELLTLVVQQTNCDSKIQKNVKLIVTELLTNAIKHVSDVDNMIRVIIDLPEKIEILKIDNGNRFDAKPFLKNPNEETLQNYLLKPVSENCWQFCINEAEVFSLDKLPEHFGFEIITRASSQFTYEFDKQAHKNIFKAIILF